MNFCRTIFAVAMLVSVPGGQDALSEPSVRVIKKYYNVQGVTSKQLIAEMKRKGPKGFWAYAKWWVSWRGNCRISLKVTYTFPRWVNKDQAPKHLRTSWNQMIKQLWKHERGHGRHGVNAAHEIEKSRCSDPKKIITKWAAQDKSYDLRTRHGRTQGVRLP